MKQVIILAAIAVALGVVALITNYDEVFGDGQPVRKAATQAKKPPLPAIDKTLVHAIEIDDGKEKVRLVRSGEKWVLPDCFDHPAQEERLTQIFAALVDLDKAEHVGSAASRHHLYEVDEGGKGKRLKLEDAGGKTIVELVIGKQDLSSGRTAANARTFVRPKDSSDVWLHGGRLTHLLYTMKRVWLDSRLVPQDYQEINKLVETATKLVMEYDDVELAAAPTPGVPPVERTGERKRLVLTCAKVPVEKPAESPTGPEPVKPATEEKKDERKWTFVEPEDAKAIDCYLPMVDGVVRQLLGGRFEEVKGKDPSAPEFGLDKPVVEVTVSFEDGSSRALKIGALIAVKEGETPTPGASARYGHLAGSGWVVSIPEYMSKGFQKKPDELKTPSETPAPPPGAPPGAPGLPGGQQPIALPEEGAKPPPGGDGKK